jgi:ABC-type transport system involved in multi-copper enzyme maturation permease subunit
MFIISYNTFKEAIRQRLILFSLLIALGLIVASKYLLRLDLGNDQIKFVFDFSSGALNFFGIIIAVVSTCSLIASEIENKTIITLLSKSVNSVDFVVGKYLGIVGVLGVFCLAVFISASAMLWFTAMSIDGASVNFFALFLYCVLQWLKLCMCVGVAIVICSLSKSFLFSVAISFMCVAICIMGETIAGLGGEDNIASIVAKYLMPNFQLLDVSEAFIKDNITLSNFGLLSAYALIYICACSMLATFFFSKRDF